MLRTTNSVATKLSWHLDDVTHTSRAYVTNISFRNWYSDICICRFVTRKNTQFLPILGTRCNKKKISNNNTQYDVGTTIALAKEERRGKVCSINCDVFDSY